MKISDKQHLLLVLMLLLVNILFSQTTNKVYVDNGILKLTQSHEEAVFFGVNYTVPFAHAYRAIEKFGKSHKKAIDLDVSQFARLELNAYRIHVWDREVSDTLGNLLNNEHIELLDYLISKLKEKNINIILTPIAWWGTGWPEPDVPTPGFSAIYSKSQLLTEPKARIAQRNYLTQFLNHKNPFTGLTYKEDPDIIAFEIINEPGHPSDTSLVTGYINEMVAVIRNEGVTKPVYYNISQNWSDLQSAAVYNANIDGISFQWYPTGLVKYAPLKGNYLAHVDHYPVPEIDDPNFKNKTRMVYEFDAADVDQPLMYPAMARSFREAGMQWATMFSYDPTFLAAYNTEYSTHYLNLIYTPQKAISLMIAANVFRTLKTYQKFNSYPENTHFNGFSISYVNQLTEMNTGAKYYHSNNTQSEPADRDQLTHIAGYGSSPLVQTNSAAAYFIDKLNDNSWRLELYPDVLERMNAYGKNSLDNRVRILLDQPSKMAFYLPGLNERFYMYPVLKESEPTVSKNRTALLAPGVYILSNEKLASFENLKFEYQKLKLNEYSALEISKPSLEVIHRPWRQLAAGQLWQPVFQIISEGTIDTTLLFIKQARWNNYRPVVLNQTDKYTWQADVSNYLQSGVSEYCIYIKTADTEMSFPSKVAKNPNAWDYFSNENWSLKVVPEESPLVLFDPVEDQRNITFNNVWRSMQISSATVLDNTLKHWFKIDLNRATGPQKDFAIQIEIAEEYRFLNINDFNFVEFEINTDVSNVELFNIQLINSAYESVNLEVKVPENGKLLRVPLDGFKAAQFVLLPRPYPQFLPYQFKNGSSVANSEKRSLDFIQISIPVNDSFLAALPKTLQFGAIRLIK